MNKRQLHIQLIDEANDRRVVENTFHSAVEKFKLFDNTTTSRIPNTLKSIVERESYGFGLGARIVGDSIIVDMFPNNSPANIFYEEVCKHIETILFQVFRNRIAEANENEFISTH